MKIAGIDLSMQGTAIVTADTDKPFIYENLNFYYMVTTKKWLGEHNINGVNFYGYPAPKEYNSNEERWDVISNWVLSCVVDCKYVNLESQSFGGMSGSLCQISEMHGVVKNYLYKNNIGIMLTPPTSNKKSFSGKGNATKLEMISAMTQKYKIDLLKEFNIIGNNLHPVEDIVDATGLCESLYKEKEKTNGRESESN